ncbi:aspartate aminotransferase family protein [Natranaerobius thermophilus]|uniref:Aminotransferase n=1 Tax=Natranaerobius thermophilus (strain ATCC BAA-1301 / DSM 18059 / JW/NM-WN-LF) TaxID=457570 RepID=B2A3S9_NATTJ|nr:aspartate aminotransferase family protein [Natranaerobius thermophilus]ACB83705.1 aminotransferase [Natranaerobius thermophilus JW/NM-WN-LF]
MELINIDETLEMTRQELRTKHNNYLNPGFMKMLSLLGFDKKFVRAEGTKVWDDNGIEYLDFLGGYGSLNLGHNPEEVFNALDKIKGSPNILQAAPGTFNAALAENLAAITPGNLQHSFFCNSGAEAVEGAVKLARRATGKSKVISAKGSFHGKTMGSLSVSGRDKFKAGYFPLVPECTQIPYGDDEALREEIDENTAAVILEPVMGEGGVIVPPEGYLSTVSEICSQNNIVFILDEIQTGLGRTGKMLACEWEQITPDIICFAKSLGGGVFPIGAFITTPELWNKAYGRMEEALMHTSTFGGNALATGASIATINSILDNNLPERANEHGEYFINSLKQLDDKHDMIKEVRGQGLLIGIEFNSPEKSVLNKLSKGMLEKVSQEYTGAFVAEKLQNEYQVLTAFTLNNPNVIRLEPPLIVDKEQIDYVVDSLDKLLDHHGDFFKLAFSSGKKAVSSFFKRD